MTPAELAQKVMDSIPDKGSNTEAHFKAVQSLIEKAILEDRERWQRRFRHIQNVLGPQPMCRSNNCEGCQHEMEEALLTANRSLEEMQKEAPGAPA